MDYHKDITQGSAFAKRYEISVEHEMLILKAFSADTFIPVSKIFHSCNQCFLKHYVSFRSQALITTFITTSLIQIFVKKYAFQSMAFQKMYY